MVEEFDSGEISYFKSLEEAMALMRFYDITRIEFRLKEWVVEGQIYYLVITGDNLDIFDGP